MALNRQKLKDLFGTDDEQENTSIASESAHNFFSDGEATTEEREVIDILSDEEDSYTGTLDLDIPDDDGLLPKAPVMRNAQAKPLPPESVDADVDFAIRTQSYIINKGQQLIELALTNAAEDGSARSIEAAAKAIETLGGSVEKLLGVYEKLKNIKGGDSNPMGSGNTFVQNQVVYQGTTSDIIKQLRR